MSAVRRRDARLRRKKRVRKKVLGVPEKPRLCIFRSAKHIYAQLIDDTTGRTIVATSSLSKDLSKKIEIGIMIEIPGSVKLIKHLKDEIDFFSIGTNDLIQYSLAIDRGNKEVLHLFQPLDPAILRMIKHLSDVAKNQGIKLFMCGEMAGYPIHVPILLGMGIDALSMNPQSIPGVKSMIRSLKIEDTRRLIQDVLKHTSATKVFELLEKTYGKFLLNKVFTG